MLWAISGKPQVVSWLHKQAAGEMKELKTSNPRPAEDAETNLGNCVVSEKNIGVTNS